MSRCWVIYIYIHTYNTHIFVEGTVSVPNMAVATVVGNNEDKRVFI